MRFIAMAALVASGTALSAIPMAAQSQSGWRQPALAQVQADLSNLEQNLRMATQVRGAVHLGVQLADVDADRAKALHMDEERGAEVDRVEPGSPAEAAGLKTGDVLLTYNGENILGARQLGRLVSETPKGRKVHIQFWRDGKMQSTVAIMTETHLSREFPGDLDIQIPDVHIRIPDIPSPMVVWRSALGIDCEPLDTQLAEYFGVKRGVLVRSVEKDSAAEKAGLKAGDVLTSVDNQPVANAHDVISSIRTERRAGRTVSVAIIRDHRPLTLSVVPDSSPQE